MFEELIVTLEDLGVNYTEDYEAGTLSIDVVALDKIALISVIQMANDSGMEFVIDETSLTIMSGETIMEPPMEEEPMDEDIQAGALDELF